MSTQAYDPLQHVDIIELCGGTGRVAQVLVRRHHRTAGTNFDIALGIDLLCPTEVQNYWTYLYKCQPKVAVISTPCTGLAGWSSLNRVINPQAWLRSRRISLPLGRLGGRTALYQVHCGHAYFN